MKFILLLLGITAAAHAANAAPGDPGKAALDFLEKVRERRINLEPGGDTALAAQTATEKKNQIARQIDRMARDLGSDPLEIGAVKLDEDYAAVLVRKTGSFDPRRLQIFPVALVKRGAGWLAAPVPASFENSGAGYVISLKKRLERLEDWMLREQVVDLENLRQQSAGRMRKRIETRLTESDLRSYSAGQVADRFLEACENKDTLAVLGLLGGLAAPLPEDWPARLKAVDRAMTTQGPATPPWRLLMAPEVVRLRIDPKSDGNHDSISLAYLDPAGNGTGAELPRIQTTTLGLTKSKNGIWQIDLPTHFLTTNEDPAGDPDLELINKFPAKWTEAHPPTPQASAELARQSLISALGNATLPALLQISKLPPNPENARYSLTEAARIWWLLHAPSVVCHAIPLGFQANESNAVAMFQFFSTREPDRLEAKPFYFEKSAHGWLWNPSPGAAVRDPFQEWIAAETQQWSRTWQQALLADTRLLEKIDDSPAPTPEAARHCVESWLDAIQRGDLPSALKLVARLDDARSSPVVLKNLSYEIASARQNSAPPEIKGIYSGKTWTAIGVKNQQGGKFTSPLYPVIQTPQGPRVLAEVDLLAAGNRGRDFLNRAAIQRLEGHATPTAITELRDLYSQHQADVANATPKPPPR